MKLASNPNITLIPLRKVDLSLIKDWRNSQIHILRQSSPLTDQDQLNYYNNTILPAQSNPTPPIILFSILKDETLIGYGGLVHISWPDRRAEVSFLLDPSLAQNPETYDTLFSSFLTSIKPYAFHDLKLNRLYTETFDLRPHHISILEKNGFHREGCLKHHVIINDIPTDSLIHACLNYESQ